MKRFFVVCTLLGGIALVANGDVIVNEFLGSTAGSDTEFIELYNTGPGAVDISSWRIELWDSDSGASYGGADGASPYTVPASTSLAAGGYYLMANALAEGAFGVTADLLLPSNSIENSSYTMILKDAALTAMNTLFVTDGGAGDSANDAGTPVTPDDTIGPDGPFLPAGAYRFGDGGATWTLLEFSPVPAPSGTPGSANIPEPASLMLLALGGLAVLRRR